MPRSKKTSDDEELNAFIGTRVATYRSEMGWSLGELAGRLRLSIAHTKSLETGHYNFTASQLSRLSAAFGRPVSAFFPDQPRQEQGGDMAVWRGLFEALPARERTALLEVGRKLAGWNDNLILDFWRRGKSRSGLLISLEGIDGRVLHQQAELLLANLIREKAASNAPLLRWYDFDSPLWAFMMRRFTELGDDYTGAFERTLLYACERLHRQESHLRPALSAGMTVITPFFFLAPRVYQSMEGLNDPTVVQAVANFLIEPDLILIFESDPELAAQRAVQGPPVGDQFYSPYTRADQFKQAGKAHRDLLLEFQPHGLPIHFVDASGDPREVSEVVRQLVRDARDSRLGT